MQRRLSPRGIFYLKRNLIADVSKLWCNNQRAVILIYQWPNTALEGWEKIVNIIIENVVVLFLRKRKQTQTSLSIILELWVNWYASCYDPKPSKRQLKKETSLISKCRPSLLDKRWRWKWKTSCSRRSLATESHQESSGSPLSMAPLKRWERLMKASW